MKRMSYLAFLLSLSLMSVPVAVHAESATDPPNIEVVQQVSGVEKVLLDYIPDDLILSLPSEISLEKTDSGYGFSDEICIEKRGSENYEVVLTLKSTDIVYMNNADNSISVRGTASLGGSNACTFTVEDIANGVSVPFTVSVDGPIKDGNYTTDFSFVVDVYRIDEVVVENKSEEVSHEEVLHEELSGVSEESIEETAETEESSEVAEDLSGVDNIQEAGNMNWDEVEEISVDNTKQTSLGVVDTEVSSDYFSQYPNLEEIMFDIGVTHIDASAFDNLAALAVIHYEGTEKQWNEIFTGNLSGVELVCFGTDEVDNEQSVAQEDEFESVEVVEPVSGVEVNNPTQEVLESENESELVDVVQESAEVVELVSGEDEETIESAEVVNPVVGEDDTIQETLENENISGVVEELPNSEADSEAIEVSEINELPIQDVVTEPTEQVVTEQSESEVID